MDREHKKIADQLAALSAGDRQRLQRLSQLAKVTPEVLFQDVCEYGFDDVEEGIQADIEAEEYFKTNAGVPHDVAMAEVRKLIGAYAKRKRQAS